MLLVTPALLFFFRPRTKNESEFPRQRHADVREFEMEWNNSGGSNALRNYQKYWSIQNYFHHNDRYGR